MASAALQSCARHGHVGAERTPSRIDGATGQYRAVVVAELRAADKGQVIVHAMRPGSFGEQGLVAITGLRHAQATSSDTETGHAFAQCLGNGSKVHGEALLAPIGLVNGDLKVAAIAGRVEVVDLEGARSDGYLIEDIAILADGDTRLGRCHATNHGRIAAQRIGKHAVIADHLGADEPHAVEQQTTGIALSHQKLASPARKITLQ